MEQNYMEILFEEMRSRFDLVLEGHAALHAKIDEYRRESNEKHDLTAFKIDTITGQLKTLNSKIDTVEQKLTDKIDTVEQKLTDKIDTVEQKLTDRIDTVEQKLTDRIDTVERNLTAHIENLATELAAHRADTEAHPRYLVRE